VPIRHGTLTSDQVEVIDLGMNVGEVEVYSRDQPDQIIWVTVDWFTLVPASGAGRWQFVV
jgi:hypothetical protein